MCCVRAEPLSLKMGIEDNLNVRPDVLARIKAVLNDQAYRDVIESSSQYNNGIVGERKLRLPYLDSQTGVAQSDCCLWMHRGDRMPGQSYGQLYSYPAKRWKKKRRQYLMNDNYLQKVRQQQQQEVLESENHHASGTPTETPSAVASSSSSLSAALKPETNNSDSVEKFYENSKEAWFGDYDDGSDLPDAGELDDPESDFDDYEEYGSKKKKKKKADSAKRKRVEYSDAEKPYSCDICGARYKTRPGLSYHYSHSHQNEGGNSSRDSESRGGGRPDEEEPYTLPNSKPPVHGNGPSPGGAHSGGPGAPPGMQGPHPGGPPGAMSGHPGMSGAGSQAPPGAGGPGQHRESPIPSHMPPNGPPPPGHTNKDGGDRKPSDESESFEGNRPNSGKPAASPSKYCDFCLGDSVENKKTKSAESLVSCSDCGRSAHPTCLQFTPNMITSVLKYRWQCIECKSCGLCGTSDNDDQLLFCDDCDRGYHMYCLKPPLSEPPEGSWSCHLCIVEYHTPKSK